MWRKGISLWAGSGPGGWGQVLRPFNVALKSGLALTDQDLFTGRPSVDPPPPPPLTVSCGLSHLPSERVHQ